jgi:hypothetical protein
MIAHTCRMTSQNCRFLRSLERPCNVLELNSASVKIIEGVRSMIESSDPEIRKTFISITYFVVVTIITSLVMIVAGRPPLPTFIKLSERGQ